MLAELRILLEHVGRDAAAGDYTAAIMDENILAKPTRAARQETTRLLPKTGKPGADLRLVAAQELQNKLKLILAGEPPYDIFVRWKPIAEQPIGWNPDLNDGVRINIRPFMTAEVLRKKPSINWSKDRGKEPERDQDQYPWFWKDGKFTGDRINDYHLTNAQKRAAQTA